MDPAHQAVLDGTVFDERLDWNAVDACMASVRAGHAVVGDVDPQIRSLAEALVSATELQQWDPLTALPDGIRQNCVCSPARMAALQCIAQRQEAGENVVLPDWTGRGQYLEIRWNEVPPDSIHLDHNAGRAHLQSILTSRLLSAVPAISGSQQFDLSELRDSVFPECNLQLGSPFSATMIIPVGDWIPALFNGQVSLGGESFCTLTAVGTHVEVALSHTGNQFLNTLRGCLRVTRRAFRMIVNDSLRRALQCPFVATRSTTSKVVQAGKNKRTVENFGPGSADSVLMIGMDATRLLLGRRGRLELNIRLGRGQECPVAFSTDFPLCPQHILHALVGQQNPPSVRLLSHVGSIPQHQILLVGPLPKEWPGRIGYSAKDRARMHELQRQFGLALRGITGARLVRMFGRHDKDPSPLFVYLEFEQLEQSQHLARSWETGTNQALQDLWQQLVGDDVRNLRLWSCSVLIEALMVASEKTLKELMAAGEAHPCPLPPPPVPPVPPPPPAPLAAVDTDAQRY
jgi:hypothetical protein